jgi:hypothetical protein
VLAGDSPAVLKQSVRERPPLKDLFQFALENNVRVYI